MSVSVCCAPSTLDTAHLLYPKKSVSCELLYVALGKNADVPIRRRHHCFAGDRDGPFLRVHGMAPIILFKRQRRGVVTVEERSSMALSRTRCIRALRAHAFLFRRRRSRPLAQHLTEHTLTGPSVCRRAKKSQLCTAPSFQYQVLHDLQISRGHRSLYSRQCTSCLHPLNPYRARH